jgi:hypothetical protein
MVKRQITWYVGIAKIDGEYKSLCVRNGEYENFISRNFLNEGGSIIAEISGVPDFAFNGQLSKTESALHEIIANFQMNKDYNIQGELEKIFGLNDED